MATSNYTRKCRVKLWFFRVLDWLCLMLPLIIYIFVALGDGGISAGRKVAVVSTVLVAIVLTIFNVIAQKRLRCPIWIILLGLFVAIKEYLLPLVIILAVTSILDDLVFTPLITHYRTALIANKQIDKRTEE